MKVYYYTVFYMNNPYPSDTLAGIEIDIDENRTDTRAIHFANPTTCSRNAIHLLNSYYRTVNPLGVSKAPK